MMPIKTNETSETMLTKVCELFHLAKLLKYLYVTLLSGLFYVATRFLVWPLLIFETCMSHYIYMGYAYSVGTASGFKSHWTFCMALPHRDPRQPWQVQISFHSGIVGNILHVQWRSQYLTTRGNQGGAKLFNCLIVGPHIFYDMKIYNYPTNSQSGK